MKSVLTMKRVNDAFAVMGIPERLGRAKGYFFFFGGNAAKWTKASVFVAKLNDKTLAEWVYARDLCECSERPVLFPYYEKYMKELHENKV